MLENVYNRSPLLEEPFAQTLSGNRVQHSPFCGLSWQGFLFLSFFLRQVLVFFWVPGSMLSCLSAFLLFCCSASLLFCFSAFLLFSFPAFCFSASLFFCFCASVPFYYSFFFIFSHVFFLFFCFLPLLPHCPFFCIIVSFSS